MAPTSKTNFKTYEASTRLLAAVIATNKVKLDFKELAAHVGGGATKDSINHRLRPIKQLAKMQAACVAKGEDPGELPIEKGVLASLVGGGATESSLEHRLRPIKQLAKMQLACKAKGEDPGQLPVDKGEIQKLFGESTPGGIEWQFRDIKAIGRAQQEAVAKGENPAQITVPGTPSSRGVSTPGSRASKASAATPGSATVGRTPASRVSTQKRKRKSLNYNEESPEDSEADETDFDAKDPEQDTPSRRPAAKKTKPVAVVSNATASPMKPLTRPSPANPGSVSGSDLSTSRSIFGSGSGTAFSSAAAAPPASSTQSTNPFDDDADALEIIDVSQMPAQKPSKPIKQEPKPRNNPPPAMDFNNPFAGIELYGLEDGEI
ncbi:hypothetical protein F5X99DRAFT_411942 [Biscogniauxia marginata]|nr:hypothetical protein F5X99DRAFT_411942 [Biscogniauxia marginata]